jgi:PAS domain S-box-containing protein
LPGRGYIRVADRASIIRDNSWNPVRVIGRSAEVPAPGLQSEGAYRAFFDSSPQATLLADSVLHILDANDAACDVLGYTRDGLKRLTLADLIPGSARGVLLELSLEDPSAIIFEEDCVRASGEVFRAKISAALVSGVDQLYVDRIITIEEMGEAVT